MNKIDIFDWNSTISPEDFNVANLTEYSTLELRVMIFTNFSYNGKLFIFKTPWIKLDCYGIPRIGEFYPNDSHRTFIKIPLRDIDVNKSLIKMFNDIKGIHTEYSDKKDHKFTEIIRISKQPKNDTYKGYYKPSSFKGKFIMDYTDKIDSVKSTIISSTYDTDGNKKKELIDVLTITDIVNACPYKSLVRFALTMYKWRHNSRDNYGNYQWGYKFRIIAMDIIKWPYDKSIEHVCNEPGYKSIPRTLKDKINRKVKNNYVIEI
jgi:hypothetical protein